MALGTGRGVSVGVDVWEGMGVGLATVGCVVWVAVGRGIRVHVAGGRGVAWAGASSSNNSPVQ